MTALGAASTARPPVHHGLDLAGVEAEGPVCGGHRGVQLVLVYDDRIGKVSLVGAGMRSNPGVTARFFSALADAGVNLSLIHI